MISFKYKILLFSIGFTTILSQLLIIREFLNVFEGNELIVGIFFCIWMMLTATGSFFAARSKKISGFHSPGFLLLIMSLLPSAEIAVLYSSQQLFFPPGSDISFPFIVLIGLAVLFPLCFISGRLFTITAAKFSLITGKNNIALSYAWESAGSIFAGLLFITSIPFVLSTFQIAGIVVLLNLIVFLCTEYRKGILTVASVLLVLLYTVVAFIAEKPIQQMHFRNQQLLNWRNTPFGNISITKTGEQINVYLNSNPLLLNDPYYYEEPVHFVLSQVPDPENVLILSGGFNQVKEVLKYPSVRHADYIEINPDIVAINQKYTVAMDDEKVNIVIDDPRNYIIHSEKEYDAVIINAPDPSSAQINRYFTREFFSEIRNILTAHGIMGISLSSSGNYMNDEALQLNGIINATLNKVFENVTLIPGERNYYVASDAPVTPRIVKLITNSGIETTYVNSYYFEDDLLEKRSNEIMNQLDRTVFRVNSDLSPFAYFVQIGYALKKTGSTFFVLLAVFVFSAVLVLMLLHKKQVYFKVFASALAASAGQFLLFFIYQVLFGNIYRMLGVVTAFYMIGLVIGSIIKVEKSTNAKIFNTGAQILLAMLLAGFGLFAVFVIRHTGVPILVIQIILLSFSILIAFSFALIFNMSTRLTDQSVSQISGSLYGIDLAGSATGIILISLVFLPILGLTMSCMISASVVIVFAIFIRKLSPA